MSNILPPFRLLQQQLYVECNQYLGNNIELYLGRDTIEGIERYKHGIKPKKQPRHKRLKSKISEGELSGIIVTPKFSGEGEIIDIEPVIQELYLEKAKEIIITWAKNKSFITKVYLFGSRVTGFSKKSEEPVKPDSDLYVAIEFKQVNAREDCFTT